MYLKKMGSEPFRTRCQLTQSASNASSSKSATKSKLSNLLMTCLVTSSLLAPTQAAWSNSTKSSNLEQPQHFVCVKEGQRLLCDPKPGSEHEGERVSNQDTVKNVAANESLSSYITVDSLLSAAQQKLIADVLIGLAFVLPCGAGLGILLYDKYCVYRADILRQQIESLEKLWHSEV